MISGSWPGELYFFKGNGQEGFSEKTQIQDKDGKVINTGNASAVFASDIDRDGDMDLVVGSIDGWVFLVPNESSGKELKFGAATKLAVDGKEINEHHSAPVIADWNGDGTLDVILGTGEGHVYLYANKSRKGAPQLSAPEVLYKGSGSYEQSDACGMRVKPHVTDWNGDGQLDLLVGDFTMGKAVKKELTAEQQAELQKLTAEQQEVMKSMQPCAERVMRGVMAEMGVEVPEGADMRQVFEGLSEEQRKAYSSKMQAAIEKDEEYQGLMKRMQDVHEKMGPLQSRPPVVGNVWVMLRKPAAPTTNNAD